MLPYSNSFKLSHVSTNYRHCSLHIVLQYFFIYILCFLLLVCHNLLTLKRCFPAFYSVLQACFKNYLGVLWLIYTAESVRTQKYTYNHPGSRLPKATWLRLVNGLFIHFFHFCSMYFFQACLQHFWLWLLQCFITSSNKRT